MNFSLYNISIIITDTYLGMTFPTSFILFFPFWWVKEIIILQVNLGGLILDCWRGNLQSRQREVQI